MDCFMVTIKVVSRGKKNCTKVCTQDIAWHIIASSHDQVIAAPTNQLVTTLTAEQGVIIITCRNWASGNTTVASHHVSTNAPKHDVFTTTTLANTTS